MVVPEGRRRKLVGASVTLNGQPARVSGVQNQFANVTQLGTGLSCEFAWETVEHIINHRSGHFES